MKPARDYSTSTLFRFWLEGLVWHCIDGSQGSVGVDGYDRGAKDFADSIQAAAASAKWDVDVQTVQTPQGFGEGHAGTGVHFDGTVYVVTVDRPMT
jgi:hypothetical protein